MKVQGHPSRRYWIWNPRMVFSIVLGNVAMIVSAIAFRFVEDTGPRVGLIALGVVGLLVVWWTWQCQNTGGASREGKIVMHGAADRVGYWSSILIGTLFVIYGFFVFPMTLMS